MARSSAKAVPMEKGDSSDHRRCRAPIRWMALGIEVAGVLVASLSALLTLPPTLLVEGKADVVASSFIYVLPAGVSVTYAGAPVNLEEEGHQVKVVYIDTPDDWRALSITFDPSGPDSVTYLTRDWQDYQEKKGVARWARLGLAAGLATAAAAAIVFIVHGFRRQVPAVAIAVAAAPWALIGGVPSIINLRSLPVDMAVEAPAVDIWLGAAALTLDASVVGGLRHELGGRALIGAIAIAVTASIAWTASWASFILNGIGRMAPR
jgi:hypothetical protein